MSQVIDKASPQLRKLSRQRIGSRRKMAELGRRIVRTIRLGTPVDTGALRNSAGAENIQPDALTVGYIDLHPVGPRRPNIPQARAIEFGTIHQRAHRANRRAVARHRLDIQRTYGEAVQEHLDSLPSD